VKRLLRIAAVVLLVVLAVALVGGFGLYRAAQHVPPAYQRALTVERDLAARRSDEMLQQATALANQAKKPGQWEAVFSAEQINGWLAVDLVENHPDALPSAVRDPRVAIEPDEMQLFCRVEQGKLAGVLTLAVEPYLPEPNVLALRIRRARAGLVPVPLDEVLKRISEAAARAQISLQWRQRDGDPVAIIPLPPPKDGDGRQVRIEQLQLRPGEVYLRGTTLPSPRPGH